MSHIIAAPCIGVKDQSCTEVCPMDCIHGGIEDKMLYIDPEECIDCGACVPACPVRAIFAEDDLPAKWNQFMQINAEYFNNKG